MNPFQPPQTTTHSPAMLLRGIRLFLLLACLGCSPTLATAAQAQRCKQLIQQSKFPQAATCYLNQLQQLSKTTLPAQELPLYKDRYLRLAADAYQREAWQQNNIEVRGFMLEKAHETLMRSFHKGYCEISDQCRDIRIKADLLRKKIHHTSLVVIAENPKTRIEVLGYAYKKIQFRIFNQKLRPGNYTITIALQNGKKLIKKLSLRPEIAMTLNVSADNVIIQKKNIYLRRKTPPLVLTGWILGGAALLTGIGMISYAFIQQGNLNAILSDPKRSHTLTDEQFNRQYSNAQTVKIVGFVVGGAGLALGAGAFIAQIAANQSNKTSPRMTTKLGSSILRPHVQLHISAFE